MNYTGLLILIGLFHAEISESFYFILLFNLMIHLFDRIQHLKIKRHGRIDSSEPLYVTL